MNIKQIVSIPGTCVVFLALSLSNVYAEETAGQPATGANPQNKELKVEASESDEAGNLPERIDVQGMKRRYWTVGNEDLMNVVQNRLYMKKGRLQLTTGYGFYSDDPFQSMSTFQGSVGYHINEFYSVHAFYASVSAEGSAAFAEARRQNITPIVNPSKSLFGAEARASLVYGKLSLLGSSIIYYDFNVALGFAPISLTSGSSTAIMAGIGQQVYLNRTFFLTMDYRILFHTDPLPTRGDRSVTTNWIQLGLGAFAF